MPFPDFSKSIALSFLAWAFFTTSVTLFLELFSVPTAVLCIVFCFLSNGFICYDTIINNMFTPPGRFAYAVLGFQVFLHLFVYLYEKVVLIEPGYLWRVAIFCSFCAVVSAPFFYLVVQWIAVPRKT